MNKFNIELTGLETRELIEAIGCYRHDMKGDLEKTTEGILCFIENKLIKEYKKLHPNFIPFY